MYTGKESGWGVGDMILAAKENFLKSCQKYVINLTFYNLTWVKNNS